MHIVNNELEIITGWFLVENWKALIFSKSGGGLDGEIRRVGLYLIRFAVRGEEDPRLSLIDFLARCFIEGVQGVDDGATVPGVSSCKES